MSLGFTRPSSVWSRAAHKGYGLTASCRKPTLILSAGAHKKSAPSKPLPHPRKTICPENATNLKPEFWKTGTHKKSAPSKPLPHSRMATFPESAANLKPRFWSTGAHDVPIKSTYLPKELKITGGQSPDLAHNLIAQTLLGSRKTPDPEHVKNLQCHADLKTSDHCLYWDTRAPTTQQLAAADEFFRFAEHTSRRLSPSKEYNRLETFEVPEIVFMCASNGEKRLTFNWVFEQFLATSTSAPGRKFKLVPYAIGWKEWRDYQAVIVDTPGLASKNSDERAQMFGKYLTQRENPYVFLMINAEHGPKMQDIECLERLRRFRIPHQVVLNRADYVLRGSWEGKVVRENQKFCEEGYWNLQKRIKEVKNIVQPPDIRSEHLPGKGEIIAYGVSQNSAFGISHLRWAILQAANIGERAVHWAFVRKVLQPVNKEDN